MPLQRALHVPLVLALVLAGCAAPVAPPEPPVDPSRAAPQPVVHRAQGADVPLDPPPPTLEDAGATMVAAGFPLPALAFEPTIGVTPEGVVIVSAYELERRTYTLTTQAVRSVDRGRTWEDATPRLQGQPFPPQSNDPYLHVDPDTGRAFLLQLQATACSTLATSDDAGASWTLHPFACGAPPGAQDHPTLFTSRPRTERPTGYPNLVHVCVYHALVHNACARSLDGGATFGAMTPLVVTGVEPSLVDVQTGDPEATATSALTALCGAKTGHGTAAPDGTLYLPTARCGTPSVAVSRDDGATWELRVVAPEMKTYPTPPDLARQHGTEWEHDVAAAVDDLGNVYAAWVAEDRQPYFARSVDGGATWSAPLRFTPPGVGTVAFLEIAAAGEGGVAFAFIGTAAAKDYREMTSDDAWSAYLAVTYDALAPQPTFVTVAVHAADDPVARGVCGGTRCEADLAAGYGDFIRVVIDAEGRPWAAFVDACEGGCVGGGKNEGGHGLVGTLAAGKSLRTKLPLTTLG